MTIIEFLGLLSGKPKPNYSNEPTELKLWWDAAEQPLETMKSIVGITLVAPVSGLVIYKIDLKEGTAVIHGSYYRDHENREWLRDVKVHLTLPHK